MTTADNRFNNVTNIKELIGQAIGAGSMCWEDVCAAGVFDDHEAAKIFNETVERLEQLLATETAQPVV
ncbi:hypothetical protein HQO42_14985 [Rhodococcus fascians]|nr:hypothetical protein [Rhodococcus fascians]MBY4237759.1 hypothetical protein [Rhodococcus fascians]MBY4253962.1 hypothetical protein [Rhodococcus fascians]MBY4269167.1 hypothetical protein [Rhodococcus fascians]